MRVTRQLTHRIPFGPSHSLCTASACPAAADATPTGTGGHAPRSARLRLAAEKAGLPRPRARRPMGGEEDEEDGDGAGVYSSPPHEADGSLRAASTMRSAKRPLPRCGAEPEEDTLTGMNIGEEACEASGEGAVEGEPY